MTEADVIDRDHRAIDVSLDDDDLDDTRRRLPAAAANPVAPATPEPAPAEPINADDPRLDVEVDDDEDETQRRLPILARAAAPAIVPVEDDEDEDDEEDEDEDEDTVPREEVPKPRPHVIEEDVAPASARQITAVPMEELPEPEPVVDKKRSMLWFVRDVAIILVIALVVAWGVKAFLVRSFFIPSPSMVPTLEVGDRLLVNELAPRFGNIDRGDIIVFSDPGGWMGDAPEYTPSPLQWVLDTIGLGSSDSEQYLIKRVIGVPGDRIVCCTMDNQLSINDHQIWEPYLKDTGLPASNTVFDVVVPEGKYWVMGDNRNSSADSRAHTGAPGGGFVDIDDVVGTAFVVTYPLSRWGGLNDYPEIFDEVPAAK